VPDLSDADLSRAYLSGANLGNANLARANFEMTQIEGANLQGADLDCVNFKLCFIKDALFHQVHIEVAEVYQMCNILFSQHYLKGFSLRPKTITFDIGEFEFLFSGKTNVWLDDCTNLKRSSFYVRKWIERQGCVKEESITDWLLYDVSQKISSIKYHAFSRDEEAKITGADWEWWFVFDQESFRYRVQAKKLKLNTDNYSSIAKTNKYGLQIDKLITDAVDKNFVPLYAFYADYVGELRCDNAKSGEGVYVCGANSVNKDFILRGKKKVLAGNVLKGCVPLSCMLCCVDECSSNVDKCDSYRSFLNKFFADEMMLVREERNFPLGYYAAVPDYIEDFLRMSSDEGDFPWERENERRFEGVNALMVYDGRKKKNEG
jgi:hypothetical protein